MFWVKHARDDVTLYKVYLYVTESSFLESLLNRFSLSIQTIFRGQNPCDISGNTNIILMKTLNEHLAYFSKNAHLNTVLCDTA